MYWNPSLYLRARDCTKGEQPGDDTGCGMLHLATPTKMTVYYKDMAAGKGTPIVKKRDRLQIFPRNFRIRVDPADNKPSTIKPHFWGCKGKNPDDSKFVFNIESTSKDSWRSLIGQNGTQHCDTLLLRLPFPPCFKASKKLSAPDSGVRTLADGLCPNGYPRRYFPELQYNLEWNLAEIFEGRDYCGSWDECVSRLVSGNNDYTGEAFHALFS